MDFMFSKFREPVNGLTHLFAACLVVIGVLVIAISGHSTMEEAIALTIYGLAQMLMFGSSAFYHLRKTSPEGLKRLRKLDHSAIYLSIAGTYTPICLFYFRGFWKWDMIILVWILAIAGIIFKLIYLNAPRWLSTGIYLIMGWLAVAGIGEILRSIHGSAIIWFFAGGIFYTIGAIIYIVKRPNFFGGKFGFHEIWHIFVILGSFSHYMVIAAYFGLYA